MLMMPQPRVVCRPDGTYAVMRGATILASGFDTHGEAWGWIDRTTEEGQGDSERAHRIAQAFAAN